MTHSHSDLASLGGELLRARNACQHAPRPSASGWDLTVDDAYAVQNAWLNLKIGRGEAVVGHKIGLTSRAMQEAMKIDTPDSGFLTADMVFEPNSPDHQARVKPPLDRTDAHTSARTGASTITSVAVTTSPTAQRDRPRGRIRKKARAAPPIVLAR